MAVDVARAWKDPEYRKTLTPEELASLPENPAGNPELTHQDLDEISGGGLSFSHCTEYTSCSATFVCSGCNDFKKPNITKL